MVSSIALSLSYTNEPDRSLDIQLLSDAFNKLKQNFQVNLVQSNETIGQDIYVLLAESALNVSSFYLAVQ